MSVEIGIIGLAKSGRTAVFNALTKGEVDTGKYTQEGLAPHIGTVKVPEPRLNILADIVHPNKIIPVSVTYIDIGASVKGLVKDKGIGGQLLSQLMNVDALIDVVRAFEDESIPHVEGNLDVGRDITNMDLELSFSDLALLERRLERIEASLKGAKPAERQGFLHEQEMLTKMKGELEKDVAIRELKVTPEEARVMAGYQFLTAKPLLTVVNVGEDRLPEVESIEAEFNSRYSRPKHRVIALCGELEMELAQLDDSAAEELRAGYDIKEPGIERVIKVSYELLDLISFFTVVSGEIRAWSIRSGVLEII